MSGPDADKHPLARAARDAQARRARGAAEDRVSFARSLGQLGMLGWLVVAPILAGVFAGRWLDRHLGTGILCSGILLGIGAAIGLWLVWQRLKDV